MAVAVGLFGCVSATPGVPTAVDAPSSTVSADDPVASLPDPECFLLELTDPTELGVELVSSDEAGSRVVYESPSRERSIAILGGVRGELPERAYLSAENLATATELPNGLSVVTISSGPVTFLVVWDDGRPTCDFTVVVSGFEPDESASVSEHLAISLP